jgi:hypothetical protein
MQAWDLFVNVEHLKSLLTKYLCATIIVYFSILLSNFRKIQEESLRTFIFAYSETYDCLSLERLAEMFELPLQSVHSIVSKMIFKEEFLVSVWRRKSIYALGEDCGDSDMTLASVRNFLNLRTSLLNALNEGCYTQPLCKSF